MIRANRNLYLVHVLANALLLWLSYEWLGVDESNTGRLLLSFVDALAILALICWLWGATFVWFASKQPRLNESFHTALRRVGALLGVAVAALVLYGIVAQLAAFVATASLKTASWLTWTLRTPIKPAIVARIFDGIVWLLRWALLPVILVPVTAALAAEGRLRWKFQKRYLLIPLLALAAIWLPLLILNWKLKTTSFPLEMTSFVVRAALSYGLFISALLAIARITSGDRSAPIPPPLPDHSAEPVPTP